MFKEQFRWMLNKAEKQRYNTKWVLGSSPRHFEGDKKSPEVLPKKEAQVTSPTACGARRTSWNPRGTGGTLVKPWWNPGGTLVEPSWNLTSGPPRTTPDPIWAEAPKLSAVGENTIKQNTIT